MRNPILLVAVLVALLASPGSALAYYADCGPPPANPIGVAGVLEDPGYGAYAITDETTGVFYSVVGADEYVLDGLVETRVIVYGAVIEEGHDTPILAEWRTDEASAGEQPDPALVQYGLLAEALQPFPEPLPGEARGPP